ncbi:DNA-directed RNA polymerase subunit alpha C-terminal domain-containing protein [Pseudoflavitalea rhizosphaerae]|uniref:DNA-directed RNA polymerase subunit alpha C-terminal domain-containing protein n=1 Tax=Pseudoflavitalea rhizosphaerae TaxID=1884793 RepID=UPI0013E0CB06|nr:DNA-directed RNA polymerase subunit alpha C-terminal domain-containing protein [Pseudoflavitalea rhizosphaerae]
MKLPLTFDIDSLSIDQQKKLYEYLKEKFESTQADFKINITLSHELIEKDIKTLRLSKKLDSILRTANISTLGSLCIKSRSDLLEIKAVGNRSVLEIESALNEWGLKLAE